jgi:ATP-dependent Clp protease, protease subunit
MIFLNNAYKHKEKSMLKLLSALVVTFFMAFPAMAQKTPTVNLTTDNTIVLNGPVNDASVRKVQMDAKRLDASLDSNYPLFLILNTPGGSIQSGLELIEFLQSLNRPVHTITIFSASMGWQIAQHLNGRLIINYGVLMSHRAFGGFRGEFPGQLDSRLEFWKRRVYEMDQVTVNRTKGKQTMESYQAAMANELWIGGQDAVEMGYADRVVRMRCSKELSNQLETVAVRTFFGSINLVFSGCPTVTGPVGVSALIRTNKGMMTIEEFTEQGGVFRGEMFGEPSLYSAHVYELYALSPQANHENILSELKKHEYRMNNHEAVVKSY